MDKIIEDFLVVSEEKTLTYVFDGEVNSENVNSLINFLNNSDQKINLFIQSNGGFLDYIYPMIDVVNNYNNLVIYPITTCSSAAFLFLQHTNKKIKFVDKSIVCVVHYPRFDSLIDFNKRHIFDREFFKKNRHNSEFNQSLKQLPLDKKEKSSLNKGNDVCIYYDKLIEIFKDRIYE